MSEIDLVPGGFVTVPRAARADWQSDHVLAEFISISECLTDVDHGPEFWAWHTDPVAAARFPSTPLVIGFTPEDAAALAEAIEPNSLPRMRDAVEPSVPEYLALLVNHESCRDGIHVAASRSSASGGSCRT